MIGSRAAWAAVAVLLLAIFGLRLAADAESDVVLILNVIPIALAAAAVGVPAGLAVAVVAIAQVAVWDAIDDVGLTLVGFGTRAVAFFGVGWLVGTAFGRARREAARAQRSERQLKLTVDVVPAIIYVAQPGRNGRWRFVSPQIEPILGYSPEEWMADPGLWWQRLHPDDRKRELLEESSTVGTTSGSEYRLLNKEGRAVWVRDDATLVLDDDGAPVWRGVLVDVTEARHRQSRLEAVMKRLSVNAAMARALAGEMDLGRVVEVVAERSLELLGGGRVAILLQKGEELVLEAGAGKDWTPPEELHIPIAGTLLGEVLAEQAPRRVEGNLAELGVLSEGSTSALLIPLSFRGETSGMLLALLGPVDEESVLGGEEEELLTSAAAIAAAAVSAASSVADAALRRSLEASERERGRWAREIHDQTLQQLAVLEMRLADASDDGSSEAMRAAIDYARPRVRGEVAALRRLIEDLRPAVLDRLGLEPALETLCEQVADDGGVAVVADIELPDAVDDPTSRLSAELEDSAYRIVQEALTNAVKHAGARRVEVAVSEHEESLEIKIADDGIGFDPQTAVDGFGLTGMRERVKLLGGAIEVRTETGAGTEIRVTVPISRRSSQAT